MSVYCGAVVHKMKLTDVKQGDDVRTDNGFDCIGETVVRVQKDIHGLYFECRRGKHYLEGQLDIEGNLAGLSRYDSRT